MFIRSIISPRTRPTCWLLAACLLAPPLPAQDRNAAPQPAPPERATQASERPRNEARSLSTNTAGVLAIPSAGRRAALPPALSRPTPASVADLRAIEQHVKALVARVTPAIVAVEVGSGSGSGVVISADGLVLTAGHVAGRGGRDARFTFPDGRTARGKTLGASLASDAGLLQITGPGSWPHVPVGELGSARVGDWVLALGLPGGFDVKRSLITRLGRLIRMTPDALQSDCTISPGDSGGALFDMHGRVIGIHSYISSGATENFHVPITRFLEDWAALAGTGASDPLVAPQAYVGVVPEDDAAGCRLARIEPNSPAAKAGLKVGDVVRKVDGREIKLATTFRRWVAESRPGETLELEIVRGEETLAVSVKLAAPPRGS